jgi:DNA-binding NtrC family response regulator
MTDPQKVLVISSDSEGKSVLVAFLRACGMEATFCETMRECRASLARGDVTLVFCDSSLKDGDYREVMRLAASGGAHTPVVVTSRLDDTGQYLEAMRLGAFDFVARPFRRSEIEWIVHNATRKTVVAA